MGPTPLRCIMTQRRAAPAAPGPVRKGFAAQFDPLFSMVACSRRSSARTPPGTPLLPRAKARRSRRLRGRSPSPRPSSSCASALAVLPVGAPPGGRGSGLTSGGWNCSLSDPGAMCPHERRGAGASTRPAIARTAKQERITTLAWESWARWGRWTTGSWWSAPSGATQCLDYLPLHALPTRPQSGSPPKGRKVPALLPHQAPDWHGPCPPVLSMG